MGALCERRHGSHEIFYLSQDSSRMIAAPIESGPNFVRPGTPQPLFSVNLAGGDGSEQRDYDVSSDGKRFLIRTPLSEDVEEPITLIVNWPRVLDTK